MRANYHPNYHLVRRRYGDLAKTFGEFEIALNGDIISRQTALEIANELNRWNAMQFESFYFAAPAPTNEN